MNFELLSENEFLNDKLLDQAQQIKKMQKGNYETSRNKQTDFTFSYKSLSIAQSDTTNQSSKTSKCDKRKTKPRP